LALISRFLTVPIGILTVQLIFLPVTIFCRATKNGWKATKIVRRVPKYFWRATKTSLKAIKLFWMATKNV